MIVSNPEDYTFIRFEKSMNKSKKYDAVLLNSKTGKVKRVAFGQLPYQQYKDKALGLYSSINHLDTKRRENYRKRHSGEEKHKYSSGWFSWYYLW